jgi:hypothetical protein
MKMDKRFWYLIVIRIKSMVGKIWVICLILLFEIKDYLQGRHFTAFRKYASTG